MVPLGRDSAALICMRFACAPRNGYFCPLRGRGMSRHPQISCLAGHRDRKRVETRGPTVPQNLGHRDSWISQIWDTGCHGSPKSGNTWLHSPPRLKPAAPLDLGTQRPALTSPKTQTTKSLGPSRPRSRPPPPSATPGPYLSPSAPSALSAPSSSLGAAILAGAALPAHLYGFPARPKVPPQRGAAARAAPAGPPAPTSALASGSGGSCHGDQDGGGG